MTDPRACTIPVTEFNHLSCADVAEFERLVRASQDDVGGECPLLGSLHAPRPSLPWAQQWQCGMTQLDMFAQSYTDAELRRDTGINAAIEHADREIAEWSDRAVEFVRLFARAAVGVGEFLAENARHFAHARGLPDPPDGRAWGAVMRRARRAGYIKNVGYRAARSSNLSPKVLWARGDAA